MKCKVLVVEDYRRNLASGENRPILAVPQSEGILTAVCFFFAQHATDGDDHQRQGLISGHANRLMRGPIDGFPTQSASQS